VALEVSVLGRSVGEAVVIRFGQALQRCILLDSFMSRRRPASLRYLEHEGIDPADVEVVAASHWDNDHANGVAELLRAAPEAQFVHPYVADPKRLVEMALTARVAAQDGLPHGLDAFGDALVALAERSRPAEAARSKQTLLEDEDVHVRALSPTSAAVNDGLVSVGMSLVVPPAKRKTAKVVRPNLTSMVLWVQTDTHRALLGADLEAHTRHGWQAAIADGRTLLLGGAQLMKVAHHGSEDADYDGVWSELLEPNPDAVVTPYAPSKRPRPADLRRMLERPCRLQVAAGPNWSGWPAAGEVDSQLMVEQEATRQSQVGVVRYQSVDERGWEVTRLTL
jgi:beta-lactamase superfamily II metal-dependent hydrolase